MPDGLEPIQGYILAFDFGKRRIGVAVGQTLTGTATPLATLANGNQPDWAGISRIVAEWKPALFLVGLPLSLDGEETPLSALARKFGANLSKRFGIDSEFQDERLTSVEAERQFADLRAAGGARRKDNIRIDAMAAKIILENWLNTHS